MGSFSNEDIKTMSQAFGCNADIAQAVARTASHSFAPRGKCIWPGVSESETVLLLAGRAHELAFGRDGGQVVVHTLARGELFGDLMGRPDANAAGEVRAVVYSRCGHLRGASLLRLMENYNAIALAVARQIAGKLARMRERMVNTVLLSAPGRIASELVHMAEATSDGVIEPAPVVSDLAVIAQTTRETASRTISQLLKRGIVSREDNALRVVAMHRLRDMVH